MHTIEFYPVLDLLGYFCKLGLHVALLNCLENWMIIWTHGRSFMIFFFVIKFSL